VKVENLTEKHFLEIFDFLAKKQLIKEAIPEVLSYLAKNPEKNVKFAIKELDLKPIKISELKEIAKSIVTKDMPFEKAVGLVMSRVRGKIEAKEVMKVVKKLLK